MAEEPTGGQGGSILTRKTGPLPNWVYMALLLLVALMYSMWRRNKDQANAVEEGPGEDVDYVPGDQTPPPVFILPQNPQPTVPVNVVVNNPGTTPSAPPAGGKPPVTTPKPKPSAPTKPAVAYDKVTVATYTSKNAPWNSTLWGIAKHAGYGSQGGNWHSIWNDPKNAALKKKRGKPENIRKGDVIYVRRK
jgi:hypothetical protein